MIAKRYLNLFLPLGFLLCFLASCGCDDDDKEEEKVLTCVEGVSECVGKQLARLCVSGQEDNYWIPFSCGVGEACQESIRTGSTESAPDSSTVTSDDADAGTSEAAAQPNTVAECIGTCTQEAHECVTTQLARHCVDGIRWETYRCEDGEVCEGGVCTRDTEGQYPDHKICDAGEKVCATDEMLKICDADETAWIGVRCADNKVCVDGACVIDTGAICDPDEGYCDDEENSLIRCVEDGVGYEMVDCLENTICKWNSELESAACVGDLCAIGSTCVDYEHNYENGMFLTQYNGEIPVKRLVRDCIDGTHFTYTSCAVNETCVQITPWVATCMDRPTTCTPGEVVCGDPDDDEVDESLFSVCVDDPQNGNEGARWVVHQCEGDNLVCDEDAAEMGYVPPCYTECTPGAERCAPADERPVDILHARQVCSEDGTWGEAEPCSSEEQEYQVCATPVQLPGELPKAYCADPVCAISGVLVEDLGMCLSETQFLPCDETGQLADSDSAVDCETGVCQPGLLPDETSNKARAEDGNIRGTCLPVDCEVGEQKCIKTLAGENTSRFISCGENGQWTTQPDTCDDNERCFDYVDNDDLWHVICGGECQPGSRECTGEDDGDTDQIRMCDDDGNWGDRTDCDFGVCDPLKNACVGYCVPDEKRCVGISKLASDGYHIGTDSVETCDDNGTWSDEEECDDDTTCRVSKTGIAIGCVECVGPNVVGGNEEGLIDSRCDDDMIQECNEDNDDFEDANECEGDYVCQDPSASLTCEGTCEGASGHTVLCAEQLIQQMCGDCLVTGYGNVEECTVTNLQDIGATIMSGCSGYYEANEYGNGIDHAITYNSPITVSESSDITITVSSSYAIESGDAGYIEYSWDNSAWSQAGDAVTGTSAAGWTDLTRTVTSGVGQTSLYIRFRFASDAEDTNNGWRINEVTVTEGVSELFNEDFETGNPLSTEWTALGTWDLQVIPMVGGSQRVITESPGTVTQFNFGIPAAWAGVENDDCCGSYRSYDYSYTCSDTDITDSDVTVPTLGGYDCCQEAVNGNGATIAWCIEEE
ncbi:MAG: hypothetical protein JXA30_08430 [Deltaproteobacteria bacterium]|nr:hypothetical protein [Deltaproteobacteria bacterium]